MTMNSTSFNINKDGHEFFAVTYKQNSELTLEPYNPNIASPQSQKFLIGNKNGYALPMAIGRRTQYCRQELVDIDGNGSAASDRSVTLGIRTLHRYFVEGNRHMHFVDFTNQIQSSHPMFLLGADETNELIEIETSPTRETFRAVYK
ncbi:8204_t:CDS:2 [Funneliformis mosseae]|uniref:8204_t:CDS:1 n=1 Tax=Funneliformis mosseae TaxID=27381 RepID=A0A9N9G2T7_FUNMO|nr:8204_t:CDS:2 [Funneliformis mosseae]